MRIKAQQGPAPAVIEPAETFSKDVEEPVEEIAPSEPPIQKPEKKWTTMKLIVLLCLFLDNGTYAQYHAGTKTWYLI